jgi:hypothetical protein
MGQVTIYIDDETERKLLNMIDKSGLSKSKWIAELIREKASTTWPENVVKLAGAWRDLPTAEEIRKELVKDSDRESL